MNATDVLSSWVHLATPSEPDHFNVVPAAGSLYLGKSSQGLPCVVSHLADCRNLPAGRETRGMRLTFHESFHLKGLGVDKVGPAALLFCLERDLSYLFAVLTEGLVSAENRSVSADRWPYEILDYIEGWQDLVGHRKRFTKEEELGLWGEVSFLLGCRDVDRAMACWFGPEGRHFDFSGNGVDIEVKTSLAGHKHYFSLQQLIESPSDSRRYIKSLYVEEDPAGGRGLADLVAELRSAVDDRVGLERKLCYVGYSDSEQYVDRYTVRDEMLLGAELIPSVRHFDDGVSEIRFRADLGKCDTFTSVETDFVLDTLLGRS